MYAFQSFFYDAQKCVSFTAQREKEEEENQRNVLYIQEKSINKCN